MINKSTLINTSLLNNFKEKTDGFLQKTKEFLSSYLSISSTYSEKDKAERVALQIGFIIAAILFSLSIILVFLSGVSWKFSVAGTIGFGVSILFSLVYASQVDTIAAKIISYKMNS